MSMHITRTELDGVLLIEPNVFRDSRGLFLETYRQDLCRAADIQFDFVQDNHSRSDTGVLRGLHYQEPMPQGKLIRVSRGAVFDVAVDVRRDSANFGRWFGVELSDANHLQVWIPPGFAHGFLTLSDATDIIYKCTDYYAPQHERVLLWNDPAVGIVWPDLKEPPRLSSKDAAGVLLAQLPAKGAYAGG
jgi:dTDP-4-dehydrorhamnose 3,5-epimerase